MVLKDINLEYEEVGDFKKETVAHDEMKKNINTMNKEFRKQTKEIKMKKEKNKLTKIVVTTIILTTLVLCSYIGVFYAGKLYSQHELLNAKNKLETLKQ